MFNIFKNFTRPSVLKAKGILGMNARNYDIIGRNNKRNLYPLVDDKVQTKVLATKAGINTPDLIGIIEYQYQVKNFVAGGNDSRAYQQYSGGSKVAAISVPVRYIHSPASVASIEDIENTKKAVSALLETF